MANNVEKMLEDAYKMGVNDATLKVNDHDVLMPKMKVKATALITEARIEELQQFSNKHFKDGLWFYEQEVEKRIKSLKKKQGSR